jgi:hypothetical protein
MLSAGSIHHPVADSSQVELIFGDDTNCPENASFVELPWSQVDGMEFGRLDNESSISSQIGFPSLSAGILLAAFKWIVPCD